MNGHEHNRRVAWIRLWGALGARAAADQTRSMHLALLLEEFASYEMRRFKAACYALETTTEVARG